MTASTWLSGPSRKAAVIRHLPEALLAVDRAATILWANESAETLGGYDADDLVGRCAFELLDPADAEMGATALLRIMDSDGPKEPWPLRIVTAGGESRWVEMAASNLLDDPGIGAILISIRALDDRYAVVEEARTIEELFRRAFEDAPIGMALVRTDGRFAHVNGALCELLRRPLQEVVGVDGSTFTHPDERDAERSLNDALLAGTQQSYELDKRFVLPDGSHVWVSAGVSLVRTPDGTPERFVLHVQDIADRKASEADLAHRATHDALTGLANRALFEDRLEQALARSRRLTTSVAVLFCDIDGFKGVNDRHGHEAGDVVLAEVAARLQEAVRPGDTVARFGGDEFVVLCEDLVSDRDLDAIAARMTRAVGRPIRVGNEDVAIGLSIGTGQSSGSESGPDLLQLADAAMYATKSTKP